MNSDPHTPGLAETDEQLALQVQNGDKEKFGILMTRYEDKLFRYGRRFLSSQDNIEDIVQEVFIKTYQSIRSFDINQKFSPWIYRIAHNSFVNELRRNSRNPFVFFDLDTLVSHPVYEDPAITERNQKEMRVMIDACLDKLSSNYKEIIILYYYEELGYKEIADILRIPVGTVGIRLKRAKEALRKAYDKSGYTYEE